MASIEKLGLATQEQTVLLDLLNHQHGLLIVVGEDAELRQVTLRTLQTYLESQHRQVAPFQPGTLICAEVLQAVGAVEESRPAPTVNYARSLPHFTPARPAVAVLPVIEDLGTLELACEQGLTGALVLATLEGVDGAGALAQLVHQGADAQLLAQSTLGVITQHTLPKACPLCRVDLAPSFELEDSFEASFGRLGFPFPGFNLREGRGCHTCDFTGYLGTVMVYEFLHLTTQVRYVMVEHASVDTIDGKAMEEGMLPWEAKLYFRLKHGDVALRDAVAALEQAREWE